MNTLVLLLLTICMSCSSDMDDFEDFKILMPPGTYKIETVNNIPNKGNTRNKIKFTRHSVCPVFGDYGELEEDDYASEIVKEDGDFYIKKGISIYEAQSHRITERTYQLKVRLKSDSKWTVCGLRKI